ncbi:coiled-coil domain-containing protein [Carboxydothermus ferrireducens]|uniref:Chromosome segregation ATPase n=1 Tax=Carboxydothermus ferrireducens DSM 11255 TaxID=1119529 RepID=A0ABX2RCD9_9THEO|nr:hypothetical protein [Carboxydothermus ferrireducens]NYE57776.1 chromosome segregation ATPase [Carboxydothermus ferrireducens DSM 11255]
MSEALLQEIKTQVNQISSMLAELIPMVGRNNEALKELRSDVNELRSEVNELKNEVNEIKKKITTMEKDIADIKATVQDHTEKLEFAMFKLINHEEQLFALKWAKYK